MSNFDENKINRQCAGTSAGGQFANKDHPANDGVGLTNDEDVVLSPEALQRLQDGEPTSEDSATLLKVVANSLDPSDTDLVYIAYDDKLTESQVDQVLRGDGGDAYEDMLDSWMFDTYYDESVKVAKDKCESLDLDFESLPDSLQDELRLAIQERDTSDPLGDLTRNTPPQLMRHELVSSSAWSQSDDELHRLARGSVNLDDRVEPARVQLIENELIKNGVVPGPLSDSERETIVEVVREGPEYLHEGVTLDAIWQGGVSEASLAHDQEERAVTATSGMNITLIDTWNGNGMEAKFPSEMSMRFTKENPAQLDSTKGRYGLDEICGLVPSAFKADLQDKEKVGTERLGS